MERMLKFWIESGDWANKTFGDVDQRGPIGPLKHIVKEVNKEIIPLIERMTSLPTDFVEAPTIDEIAEELFDLQHLIFDVARRLKLSYSVYVTGCFDKLEINKNREWPRNPNDTSEAIEHKR